MSLSEVKLTVMSSSSKGDRTMSILVSMTSQIAKFSGEAAGDGKVHMRRVQVAVKCSEFVKEMKLAYKAGGLPYLEGGEEAYEAMYPPPCPNPYDYSEVYNELRPKAAAAIARGDIEENSDGEYEEDCYVCSKEQRAKYKRDERLKNADAKATYLVKLEEYNREKERRAEIAYITLLNCLESPARDHAKRFELGDVHTRTQEAITEIVKQYQKLPAEAVPEIEALLNIPYNRKIDFHKWSYQKKLYCKLFNFVVKYGDHQCPRNQITTYGLYTTYILPHVPQTGHLDYQFIKDLKEKIEDAGGIKEEDPTIENGNSGKKLTKTKVKSEADIHYQKLLELQKSADSTTLSMLKWMEMMHLRANNMETVTPIIDQMTSREVDDEMAYYYEVESMALKDSKDVVKKIGVTDMNVYLTTGKMPGEKGGHGKNGDKKSKLCTHCDMKGHTTDDCWKLHPEKQSKRGTKESKTSDPKSKNGKGQDKKKCSACHNEGHSIAECKDAVCHGCHEKGHIKSKCPKNTSTSSNATGESKGNTSSGSTIQGELKKKTGNGSTMMINGLGPQHSTYILNPFGHTDSPEESSMYAEVRRSVHRYASKGKRTVIAKSATGQETTWILWENMKEFLLDTCSPNTIVNLDMEKSLICSIQTPGLMMNGIGEQEVKAMGMFMGYVAEIGPNGERYAEPVLLPRVYVMDCPYDIVGKLGATNGYVPSGEKWGVGGRHVLSTTPIIKCGKHVGNYAVGMNTHEAVYPCIYLRSFESKEEYDELVNIFTLAKLQQARDDLVHFVRKLPPSYFLHPDKARFKGTISQGLRRPDAEYDVSDTESEDRSSEDILPVARRSAGHAQTRELPDPPLRTHSPLTDNEARIWDTGPDM